MTAVIKLIDYLERDKIVIIDKEFSSQRVIEVLLNVLCNNNDIVSSHKEEI